MEECICGWSLFFEDSESGFEADSATTVFCSITGLGSAFTCSAPDVALVLLLFIPGLALIPGLGLLLFTSVPAGFPLLAGGSGGFPANGFRLLFLRKTLCCLLTAVDGPFFCGTTLLFFLAGDASREGAGDLRPFTADGRGMREGEGWASFSPAAGCFVTESPLCLFTLLFIPFFGEDGFVVGGKLFLKFDTEALRCWVTDRFLEGEGSRDTGCERGIRDFPGGGRFLFSLGDGTRIDLADPGNRDS